MRLSEYASTRKTRGSYKLPRSVQQSIPIDRIYADGVWQSGNVFSMMWQISDINYAMQSDAAKQNILTQLGTVYAVIPADCWMQVCIVSQRMDEKAFARDVLYHRENDGYDALRAERNRLIKASARENGNVVQHKYIIVSTNKSSVKDARERFVQVQGHLLSAFSALECSVTPLDNRARLEVLHKFFRISEEGRFNFDFDNCAKLGQDFRDSIAPDCIRFCKKHIEIEDFYAKCMTISEYPQQLDDKFISALLQQVPYIVLSIDIEPVETEDAFKEIDSAQMKTDAEKVRFNKKSVENLDFTSSVPQRTQEQDRIIANIRKEMTENDQQMFLSLLTVTYFADTLEDLALETDALKTTAANYNCRFTELYFQQERAFNTAMPYGLRRIESVRTMLTKSLTALVPFNTQEILTPGGICYGRNAVTGNLIIGLRTTLVNGNAMVVATSGGGKSMFVKLEILMLYLRFTKARFYIVDPENEYAPLVQELGGEVVNISVDSSTYFNPLDFKPDKSTDIPPYVAKAEFVLSLCEQIMKKENVLPGDRSLIDRALRSIYKPLIESKYTAPCPTIKDLWAALNSQGDNRSKKRLIQDTFWAMHEIDAEVEEVTATLEPTEDEPDPEPVTEYILHIAVSSKSVDALADLYRFTQDQRDILHQLLSEEMRPSLLALCGGIAVADGELCWPLPGHTYISCHFGEVDAFGNAGHRGTDIPAPEGTPILAAHSGTVLVSGWNDSYGNQVLLDNGAGLSTRYAHMTQTAVTAGEAVTAGQVIGYVGNTGDSTGFHLHFEVMQNGLRVNPMDMVCPQEKKQ